MYNNGKLIIAKSNEEEIGIIPKLANRHGLVAGATGTGKTVTLRTMAEAFSDAGIPVFMADVKGDLAGICKDHPVNFWDIYAKKGLPLRTTITEMGPTLLARLMDLTPTQEDILSIVFKIADDEGMLLIDSKDLRAMITYVSENASDYSRNYGNMSKASLNVIQRSIVALEEQGADVFFGEPALDIKDWFKTDIDGRGVVNIMHSESLINNPKMYSTFMLWLLSELFEVLPESGDLPKPRMIFFFDEAHLLFNSAPKALLEKIEQVVKLIRSKGVGVYFCTQNPKDIPDGVLAQLGNKVQHALHAYTPAEQKAIKAAADSFRPNPEFDTKEAISSLGIGEALISFLEEGGTPAMVRKAKVLLPNGELGPIDDSLRNKNIESGEFYIKYRESVDRDSAYEFLQRKWVRDQEEKERQIKLEMEEKEAKKALEKAQKEKEKNAAKSKKAATNVMKNVAKTTGSTLGREIGNTLGKSIGGNFGKKLGGNIGSSLGRGILGSLFGK